jgi:hypothetical protein
MTHSKALKNAVALVADIVNSDAFVKPNRPHSRVLAYYIGKRAFSPRMPTAKDANGFTFEGAIARTCSHSTALEFEVIAFFKLFTSVRPDEFATRNSIQETREVVNAALSFIEE